jgi:hypothetical protein
LLLYYFKESWTDTLAKSNVAFSKIANWVSYSSFLSRQLLFLARNCLVSLISIIHCGFP